jgi:hypothetical protein
MAVRFRRYLGVALVFLLALTSQGMAVARGTTSMSGPIQLCTGTGPVMVYVDENGTPTGPPMICPDWALMLIADTSAMQPVMTVPGGLCRAVWTSDDVAVGDRFRPRTSARGPPIAA